MHTMPAATDDGRPRHETVRTLALMGRTWTLRIRASDLLLSQMDHRLPLVMGSSAALLSLVLAALVWALVSARQRAEQAALRLNQALVVEHNRLAAILEGTRVGTWEWNVQTGETTFNDEWARLIGYELAELTPVSIATWLRLTHPDDLVKSEQMLQRHFSGELPYYDCEARMRHKDGHWVWVQDRGMVASRTPDGKPLMMYGTHQDISQHKQQEEIYKHGAHHDPLTDLPNRVLLGDRLTQALQLAVREHTRLAVMYMDLDGFKRVNDEHGHEAGDVVLQTLARRIQRSIRASDTLARIGGDEFVVLLQDVHDEQAALQLAEKFNAEVRRPIPLPDGGEGHVSLSIGIAVYPQHGTSADELSERADQAMYQVKKGGKNAARVYRSA
jgi:diguanylate cyclase (GGDEF)-like protein/PAS domain S-box-containing protein